VIAELRVHFIVQNTLQQTQDKFLQRIDELRAQQQQLTNERTNYQLAVEDKDQIIHALKTQVNGRCSFVVLEIIEC
jgi:hypothetical protein